MGQNLTKSPQTRRTFLDTAPRGRGHRPQPLKAARGPRGVSVEVAPGPRAAHARRRLRAVQEEAQRADRVAELARDLQRRRAVLGRDDRVDGHLAEGSERVEGDVDGEEGQLRAQVRAARGVDAQQVLTALREGLPDCQISYVSAEQLA